MKNECTKGSLIKCMNCPFFDCINSKPPGKGEFVRDYIVSEKRVRTKKINLKRKKIKV